MRPHARNPRVVDVLDRVGRARVLRDGVGVKVDEARVLVEDDVLEDGAEADGLPNLRLLGRLEADALGVAAACPVVESGGREREGEKEKERESKRRLVIFLSLFISPSLPRSKNKSAHLRC